MKSFREEHPEWIDQLHDDLETIGLLADAIMDISTNSPNGPRSIGEIEELVQIAVRLAGFRIEADRRNA